MSAMKKVLQLSLPVLHSRNNTRIQNGSFLCSVLNLRIIKDHGRAFSEKSRNNSGSDEDKIEQQEQAGPPTLMVGPTETAESLGLEEETTEEDWLMRLIKEERVFLIQPDFKWGKGRFLSKAVNNRLGEAEALVHSISKWKVKDKQIEPIHELNPKFFFGTGKVQELKNKVGNLKHTQDVTSVFVNTGKLSGKQTSSLEGAFGCTVFDRYRVVLEIFKERARTKEAKMQVRLAGLQYQRWHLKSETTGFDQQRGGIMAVGGGGETHLEIKKRLLSEKESKIKRELHHIQKQRKQNRTERINKHIPQIALIGYTNAGKTTFARALSGDTKLEPEDKLFATLDTTAHRGKLPCGLGVVFIDTVGFISDLPHELIQSFSATLEDVKNATLLVHVRDMTDPEYENQKKSVLQVLSNLNVDQVLMENMIEIHNKADLWSKSEEQDEELEESIPVSALKGIGVEDLKYRIEKKVFDVTRRNVFCLKIDPQGPSLSWLHHNATILSTEAMNDNMLEVQAIMDDSTYSKWKAKISKG